MGIPNNVSLPNPQLPVQPTHVIVNIITPIATARRRIIPYQTEFMDIYQTVEHIYAMRGLQCDITEIKLRGISVAPGESPSSYGMMDFEDLVFTS